MSDLNESGFIEFTSLFGMSADDLKNYVPNKDKELVARIYADFRWKLKIRQVAYEDMKAMLLECIARIEKEVRTPEVKQKAIEGFRLMETRLSEFAVDDFPDSLLFCSKCGREIEQGDYRKVAESGDIEGNVICEICSALSK